MIGASRISQYVLYDYIDGRLPLARRVWISVLALFDDNLADRLGTIRWQNRRLQNIGRSLMVEPLPARTRHLLNRAEARTGHSQTPGFSSQIQQVSLAAILIGVIGCIGLWAF